MPNGGNINPSKPATNIATSTTSEKSSRSAIENCSANATLLLAPRFTNEEKKILYDLFGQHEDVIDIKNRKKQRGMYSVRDAWQSIVDDFNGHPNVATQRNLKQIQKFWLNARLRKQYPLKSTTEKKSNVVRKSSSEVSSQQGIITVPVPIKCEPEYSIQPNDTPDTTENDEEYEEIELQGTSVGETIIVESLGKSANNAESTQSVQQENQHQHATIQPQQIHVDQISAEKLTLNDLLQFKNARPREQIILQIKQHPGENSNNLPLSIPHQQFIGEVRGQQETSHIQVQHYHTQPATHHVTQNIQQPYSTANTTYCNYSAQNLPIVTTRSSLRQADSSENVTNLTIADTFEQKLKYFKLKETELRHKELQLQLEKKRIEISRMEEELRYLKEMHRLQVDEMKIKIKILYEEEKQLKNKEC